MIDPRTRSPVAEPVSPGRDRVAVGLALALVLPPFATWIAERPVFASLPAAPLLMGVVIVTAVGGIRLMAWAGLSPYPQPAQQKAAEPPPSG